MDALRLVKLLGDSRIRNSQSKSSAKHLGGRKDRARREQFTYDPRLQSAAMLVMIFVSPWCKKNTDKSGLEGATWTGSIQTIEVPTASASGWALR